MLTRAALAGAVLIIAGVIWPLGPLADQLFAFHMTQHLLLAALAAPLLVLILAAATPFWSVALGENVLNDGARALYVMTAALVMDLPGVVMLFAPRAFCAMPGENAAAFGITPLEDQQIAGLLMWVPANLVFFAIATFLFARWLQPKRNVAV